MPSIKGGYTLWAKMTLNDPQWTEMTTGWLVYAMILRYNDESEIIGQTCLQSHPQSCDVRNSFSGQTEW